ncbi:MAG: diacylglycerol kinase family protein [Polyangiaceae bacterium]
MTVDVILNPNARRLATNTAVRRALWTAARRGGARVHETRTLEELERVAHAIAARSTDAVVLAGGDGSHMAGISALSRACRGALPPIALAPCGTVCTVARNFGMLGGPRRWTERVVLAACSGAARTESRPTLCVRDDGGGERVGFIFGAGLVARFFDAYYQAPRQGLATAARIAARVFAGSFFGLAFARSILEPARWEVSIDGGPPAGDEWSLLLASVVRDVGLHLIATYRAGEVNGRFHVVGSGLPPRALGPQLPRVLVGRPLKGGPRVDVLAHSLRLVHRASAGAYVLDGDVFRARETHVEDGPRLRLLVPPRIDLRAP